MRQNDFGGALSATRIAARITAGCVTTTSRVRRVVSESIHQPHPVDQLDHRFATVRRPRRVGQPDRQVVGLHAAYHVAAPASAVQIRQPVVDAGVQTEQFGRLPGPLLRAAIGAFGDTKIDRRVDLAVADRIERFVGGKPSGRHRIGHRVRYECQPDDLTHASATARSGPRSSLARARLRDSRRNCLPPLLVEEA